MPYLDDLVRQLQYTPPVNSDLGLPRGAAYSSYYPAYETQTPQFPTPNPFQLAQMGYRFNELVYSLTNIRAYAVSEAPMRVMTKGDASEEVKSHALAELMQSPTPNLSGQEFWQVVETYLCIAGFSTWEKERNNYGEVVRLWPMRPDWCSFLRGQQKPIRAIRYQPYGLPPHDIPAEEIVIFQYFDPLWPLMKSVGPTQAAMKIINVDNNATELIGQFLKNGGFMSGILKTEQTIADTEAERIKARWRQNAGGPENAGGINVLGSGVEYQHLEQTFRDMVFPELDARTESRICMTYRVPPMLANAKVGLDRSTYSNYQEARKAFYESTVTSEWGFLAGQLTEQLLPDFDGDSADNECKFDVSKIKALQEDRTAKVTRAVSLWTSQIATLDEARQEADLNAIGGEEGKARKENQPALPAVSESTAEEVDTKDEETPAQPVPPARTQAEEDAADAEKKAFRKFAKARVKENKFDQLREFEFKHVPEAEQERLINEFEIDRLAAVINQVANQKG
jgi:HK97 family phage portal protein